jgi:lipopolysaccharide heptosyltransferase II
LRLVKIGALKFVDRFLGRFLTATLPGACPTEKKVISPGSFLFIRPGGIGDAVLLVPAIQALRRSRPEAVVHVLAESRNAAVFGLCPEVDGVFRYDRPKEFLAALGGCYDAVIDTEQWHRLSAVMARFIRSSVKIGFATNERKKFFNFPVSYAHETYELQSFFNLLHPFGISLSEAIEVPFLEINPLTRKTGEELLGDILDKPFVALFPGASIPERRWGTKYFHAVVAALSSRGIPFVVLGGAEDTSEGQKIVAGTGGLNLAGRTSLIESAAVIERCSVLVSGDSGILHIGVGLGKPTVSLFGPGIAAKWAPRDEQHIVLNKNLSCSPCTRFGNTPTCPHNARCLSEITVDEVVKAVETLLKRLNIS